MDILFPKIIPLGKYSLRMFSIRIGFASCTKEQQLLHECNAGLWPSFEHMNMQD